MKIKNIKDFFIFCIEVLRRYLRGSKNIANFDLIEQRIQICRACEYRIGDFLNNMKCNICSCRIKYKVRFISSTCPKKKW